MITNKIILYFLLIKIKERRKEVNKTKKFEQEQLEEKVW